MAFVILPALNAPWSFEKVVLASDNNLFVVTFVKRPVQLGDLKADMD